jgi:hypothetical protein
MNVYPLGNSHDYSTLVGDKCHTPHDEKSVHNYGDFVFQKRTSKNMDKLWLMFHEMQDYPELYLGVVEKMALCKCPITEKNEWHSKNLFADSNPSNGDRIILKRVVKNNLYHRECIFVKWEKEIFYEWKMTSGNILQLRQKYIDGLSPKDKRYLKISS